MHESTTTANGPTGADSSGRVDKMNAISARSTAAMCTQKAAV